MISVHQLTKTYGSGDNEFVALFDISFDVPTGSTVAIIGKSGSGKSTLMHIMSGLDHPSGGTVIVDEVNIFRMKAKEIDDFRATQMSFIFQAFFVEANQTAYQNVMLPLEIARVPIGARRAMVMEALRAVELEGKADVLAASLSGGQKQRLAIARAIVNKPRIIFADEPTGNLDSVTGDRIMDLLFGLNEKLSCTLVLVTHDNDLAQRCQMRISLTDGKLVAISNKPAGKAKTKAKPAKKGKS